MAPVDLEALGKAFRYDSSEVDWCEPNHQISPYISEFFNTLSNVPLCVAAVSQLVAYRDLRWQSTRQLDPRPSVCAALFLLVGLGSALFHATLSIAGQMADELFILYLMSVSASLFWPLDALPPAVKSRRQLTIVMAVIAVVCTLICNHLPTVNHYGLALLAVPEYSATVISHNKRPPSKLSSHLLKMSTHYWLLAFAFWAGDKAFCGWTLKLGLPIGHAIWHVLSGYAFCYSLMHNLHLEIQSEHEELSQACKLKKSPKQLGIFGFPYLEVNV